MPNERGWYTTPTHTRFVSGKKDYYKSIVMAILQNGGVINHRKLYYLINPHSVLVGERKHNIPTSHYAKYISMGLIVKVGPGRYAVNPVLLASGCHIVNDAKYDILSDTNKIRYYKYIQGGMSHDEAMAKLREHIEKREARKLRAKRRKLALKPVTMTKEEWREVFDEADAEGLTLPRALFPTL
jgi:hypothetical protein